MAMYMLKFSWAFMAMKTSARAKPWWHVAPAMPFWSVLPPALATSFAHASCAAQPPPSSSSEATAS
jgi:hypothetical protein